jgi:hypothetical protein
MAVGEQRDAAVNVFLAKVNKCVCKQLNGEREAAVQQS